MYKKGGGIIKKCSFCGSDLNHAGRLVQSRVNKEVFICSHCADIVKKLHFKEEYGEEACQKLAWKEKRGKMEGREEKDFEIPFMTPREIHGELNRFIIGQEKAKKVLSVAVCNHIKRLNDNTGLIKKSNILLAGASGTGKTLFAKTLANLLKVPFAILDATTMTAAGYVGNDVETCLQQLLEKADGNVNLAQKGVVYIDEIDKLARSGQDSVRTSDCSGINVQASLLKMIEGCEIEIPTCGKTRHFSADIVKMDTQNILFICGGAFASLTRNIASPRPIGIRAFEIEQTCNDKSSISPESLVKYGLMQELVGRLPIIISLDDLQEDDLVRILTEPEDSITKEYELLFEKDGVKLSFEKDALYGIAKKSIKNKSGARGLRSILEEILVEIMYDLPDRDISECCITKETLLTKTPTFIKKAMEPPATMPR